MRNPENNWLHIWSMEIMKKWDSNMNKWNFPPANSHFKKDMAQAENPVLFYPLLTLVVKSLRYFHDKYHGMELQFVWIYPSVKAEQKSESEKPATKTQILAAICLTLLWRYSAESVAHKHPHCGFWNTQHTLNMKQNKQVENRNVLENPVHLFLDELFACR